MRMIEPVNRASRMIVKYSTRDTGTEDGVQISKPVDVSTLHPCAEDVLCQVGQRILEYF